LSKIFQLTLEIQDLNEQLSEAQSKCATLKIQIENSKKMELILKKNFSSLLLTAQKENERKDRQLQELRSQSGNPKRFTKPLKEVASKTTQTEEIAQFETLPKTNIKKSTGDYNNGDDRRAKRSHSPRDEYENHRKRAKTYEIDDRKSNDRRSRYDDFGKHNDCHSDKRRNDSRKSRNDNSRSRRSSRERVNKEDSQTRQDGKQLKENKSVEREGNADATKHSRR
jgi:hypothetical protein